MKNDIQDERYYVAEESICDAFLQVLGKKDMGKVTVNDIVKRAGIVRSTFYNHYENVPALIETIEDKTIQDIFSLMETFHPKNDWDMCKSFFLTICEYTMNNPFLSGLLKTPRSDTFFEKAITMFHNYVSDIVENRSSSALKKDEFSYMVACTIGCTLGVLHKWTVENCQVPANDIADILTRAFMNGMFPSLA